MVYLSITMWRVKVIAKEYIEKLKFDLDVAEKAANVARIKLREAQDEFSSQLCPHKIGDIVQVDKSGKQIKIDKIMKPKWSFNSSAWRAEGFVIKKNGEIGLIRSYLES